MTEPQVTGGSCAWLSSTPDRQARAGLSERIAGDEKVEEFVTGFLLPLVSVTRGLVPPSKKLPELCSLPSLSGRMSAEEPRLGYTGTPKALVKSLASTLGKIRRIIISS
ncbi:hypothetical protein U1Q18_002755 [Sarracenia purpurea var. burkii]